MTVANRSVFDLLCLQGLPSNAKKIFRALAALAASAIADVDITRLPSKLSNTRKDCVFTNGLVVPGMVTGHDISRTGELHLKTGIALHQGSAAADGCSPTQ